MGDIVRQQVSAGSVATLNGGRYFKLIQAAAPVDVIFWTRAGTKRVLQIDGGYSYGPVQAEEAPYKVEIASATTQTIAAFTGDDIEDYDRVLQITQVARANSLADAADVVLPATTVTLLVAANASRRRVMLTNLAGSTQTIRVGTSNVGAARGLQLQPGQTLTLETLSEVRAWAPATGATVSILEELF